MVESSDKQFQEEVISTLGSLSIDDLMKNVLISSYTNLAKAICDYSPEKKPLVIYQLRNYAKVLAGQSKPRELAVALELVGKIGRHLLEHPTDTEVLNVYTGICDKESSRFLLKACESLGSEDSPDDWITGLQRAIYLRHLCSCVLPDTDELIARLKASKSRGVLREGVLAYRSDSGAVRDGYVWVRMTRSEIGVGRDMELAVSLSSACSELINAFLSLVMTRPEMHEHLERLMKLRIGLKELDETENFKRLNMSVEGRGEVIITVQVSKEDGHLMPRTLQFFPLAPPTPAQRLVPMEGQLHITHRLLSLFGLSHVLVPKGEEESP